MAALNDGGAIVVYTQTTRPDPDVYAFDYEMFAQRYDADGVAVGAPVEIDTQRGLNNDGSSLIPVVTAIVAYVLLKEAMTPMKIGGIFVVITGLLMSQIPGIRRKTKYG